MESVYEVAFLLTSTEYRKLKKKNPEAIEVLERADRGFWVDATNSSIGKCFYFWHWRGLTGRLLNNLRMGIADLKYGLWAYDVTKDRKFIDHDDHEENVYDVIFIAPRGTKPGFLHIDPNFHAGYPPFDGTTRKDAGSFNPKEGIGSWL